MSITNKTSFESFTLVLPKAQQQHNDEYHIGQKHYKLGKKKQKML